MSKHKWSFAEERLELIQNEIQTNASVIVSDLAKKFHVSESTIRLDLTKLESENRITRTHGGAIIKKEVIRNHLVNSESIAERIYNLEAEKDAIGKKAASLIEDGDTLLIDGGSTTYYVVKHLLDRQNLTIITNSLIITQEIIANPCINVFLLGGMAISKHGVLVGALTNQSLSGFYPNKTILGIDGISIERGLMAADPSIPAIASIKSEMVKISNQLIIVCDHTKFNKICPMSVATLEAADVIVTDSGTSVDIVKEISKRGPKVLIAN